MHRLALPFLIFCLVAAPGLAGEPLWEWVTPTPQGHDLFAAASGNGVVVAVGHGGTVVTSAGGGERVMTLSDDGYSLMDVVWANGLFVAVGGQSMGFGIPSYGVVLTSSDGFTWTERHRTGELELSAAVWTGTQFVAVGVGGEVLISPDGLSWSERQIVIDQGWAMADVAWNGVKIVAVGYDNVEGFGFPAFFTSENGEAWSVQNFECEYCDPGSIASVGGRFVAVGSWRKALVSDDGLTWTEAPHETPNDLDVVVGAGDRFLAIGHDVLGTSFDGYSWSITDLPTESPVYGLAGGGDGYLAVGDNGFMMSSPDGSEWTQVSEKSFDVTGTWEIRELATNGSTIVGVGDVIVTGRHGTEWTRRYSPVDSDFYGVVWTGTSFWAAGERGIIRSIDGVHWAQMLLVDGIWLSDIEWNGSLFAAVGRFRSPSDGRKVILTSPDGHEWTYHFLDFEGHLFTVGWTGSRWVAVGSGARLFTSPDGLTWQPRTLDEGLTLKDMAWNGDRLVAVGGRAENGGLVLSTEDGVSWVESALPEAATREFDDVTWTGTHFVAVSRASGDVVFTSTDGLEWTSETTATGVWPVSAVGDDRSLFVTGRGLKIIRRTEPLQGIEAPRRPDRRVVPVGEVRKEDSPPVSSSRE